jgi:hypothetical protein
MPSRSWSVKVEPSKTVIGGPDWNVFTPLTAHPYTSVLDLRPRRSPPSIFKEAEQADGILRSAAVKEALRRPRSIKPGGDAAHDYRASAAERRTVGPGNVSVSRQLQNAELLGQQVQRVREIGRDYLRRGFCRFRPQQQPR